MVNWMVVGRGLCGIGCVDSRSWRCGQPQEESDDHRADEHRQPEVREDRTAQRDDGDPRETLEVRYWVHGVDWVLGFTEAARFRR